MALCPSGPAGFPGWKDLAPNEAMVWGYLLLPGRRCLRALAMVTSGAEATEKERTSTYSSLKNAKARGAHKLDEAAKAHGTDLATILHAYRSGQKVMANAPKL